MKKSWNQRTFKRIRLIIPCLTSLGSVCAIEQNKEEKFIKDCSIVRNKYAVSAMECFKKKTFKDYLIQFLENKLSAPNPGYLIDWEKKSQEIIKTLPSHQKEIAFHILEHMPETKCVELILNALLRDDFGWGNNGSSCDQRLISWLEQSFKYLGGSKENVFEKIQSKQLKIDYHECEIHMINSFLLLSSVAQKIFGAVK